MRTIVILVAAAFWASASWAQERAVEIPFAPGARAVFDIREVRTRTSTDQSGPNGEGRVQATLQILGAGAPYSATWTTNSVEADGVIVNDRTPGAASFLIGVPIALTLDESGAPLVISDWDGLRQRIFQAVREMTPEGERTDEWLRATQATERMFNSMNPTTAAQQLLPDISIISLCQHTGLTIGEPLRSETQTANVLGGPPIQTSVSFELRSVDRQAGTANIEFTSSLDPASVTASMRETMERVLRETGRDRAEVMAEFEGVTLRHNTRADCVVDLQTGVTRSVTHNVSISMGAAGTRSDRRVITVTRRE